MSKEHSYEDVVKEMVISENKHFKDVHTYVDPQELLLVIRDMDRRIEDLERKVAQK
jgi:hypothetical protein